MPAIGAEEVLVLLSGGIDSTALVAFYAEQQTPIAGLWVGYGQAAADRELAAATAVATHYDIELRRVRLHDASRKPVGEIRGRNSMLVAVACMEAPPSVWGVAIGIHAGTSYPDCSPDFVERATELLSLQQRPVTVLAPFVSWPRPDIIRFCKERRVPISLTYSCELGTEPPCGACLSCKDREGLDVGA